MDIQQANIERFNKNAAGWDEEPRRVKMAHGISSAMLARLAPTGRERVLEFGCGTGLITTRLAPHVSAITGLDSSSQMLDVLRQKSAQADQDNISIVQGNVPADLPAMQYDLIVSSMTLHHIPDIPALLHRLYEHLVPGGRVAFADLDAEDGTFHSDLHGVVHFGFDRSELGIMLSKAGYEGVSFTTAYTVERKDRQAGQGTYPIFLVVANKPQ